MLDYTRNWVQQELVIHDAQAWMKANNPLDLACHCMFHLNRYVRRTDSVQTHIVYGLKNHLVEWLYKHDYCIAARRYRQDILCWCGGEDPDCYKCDGTGIYRSHWLWSFVFNVNDRKYVWHQPERQVTWAVTPTNCESGIYEDAKPISDKRRQLYTPELRYLYITVVDLFLGTKVEGSLDSLMEAISLDLMHLRWKLYNTWPYRAYSKVYYFLKKNEIPF